MKILFLPGLLCTDEIWGTLNQLRRDFECIDADLTTQDTITSMTETVVELIAKESIRSVVAIGISMGGYVALGVALQKIPQIRKVILINTTSLPVDPESIAGRLEMIEKAQSSKFMEVLEESKGFCFFKPTEKTDALEIRMGIAIGPQAYICQQKAIISRLDVTEMLGEINIPTLVITGKNDPVLPVGDSYKMFDSISGSKLVAYSNCGHLATLEGDGIYDDVLSFIKKG